MGRYLAVVLVISFLAGCGGGAEGPQRATVQGKVTFDGEPLESGFIEFIPDSGVNAAPVKLTISSGSYDTASDPMDDRGIPLGNHTVVVRSWKETGQEVKNEMGEMEQEVVQIIPEKYNTSTELKAEVTAETDTLDFDLIP